MMTSYRDSVGHVWGRLGSPGRYGGHWGFVFLHSLRKTGSLAMQYTISSSTDGNSSMYIGNKSFYSFVFISYARPMSYSTIYVFSVILNLTLKLLY